MTMRTKSSLSIAQLRVAAETQAKFVAKVARNATNALNRLANMFQLSTLDGENNEIRLRYVGENSVESVVAARTRLQKVLGVSPSSHDTYDDLKIKHAKFNLVVVNLPKVLQA